MTGSRWFGYDVPEGSKNPSPRKGSFNLQDIYRFERIKLRSDSPDWQWHVYLQWQPGVGVQLDEANYNACAVAFGKWNAENNPEQLAQTRDEMNLWRQRAQLAEAKLADANAELAKLKGVA